MALQCTSSSFQVDLQQGTASQGVGSCKHAWLFRGLGFAGLLLVCFSLFPSHAAKAADHFAVSAFSPGLPGVRARGWPSTGIRPVHKGALEARSPVLPETADGVMPDSYPAAPANLRKKLAVMQVRSQTRAEDRINPDPLVPFNTVPVEPPMTADVVSHYSNNHNAPGFPVGRDRVIIGADSGFDSISFGWLSILVIGAGAVMVTTARSAQQRSGANTTDPASSNISLQRSRPLTMMAGSANSAETPAVEVTNFVRNIIKQDLENGKHQELVTRFPPEPNGYLHIGHAKSICVNFGLGEEFAGRTYMRFDDTNPAKEEQEYVDSIMEDVKWLGFDWGPRLTHASDYFPQFYAYALELIKKDLAYVESLTAEEMSEYRGRPTRPGKLSPYRTRSVQENLELFEQMRSGALEDGSACLRLKIDMSSPNMNLRDPTIYRIKREAEHPMTGTEWNIYPMYDYAHVLTDALEGITHSLCTTEFEAHRPLYEWVLEHVDDLPATPRQIEFSRLNLEYTVLSKRKLIQLVTQKHVNGWDDPRLPTLCGLRRRGVPPEAIRLFVERTGVSKAENNIDYSVLEDCVRAVLDPEAPRAMGVLEPLKLTITNWPEGEVDMCEGPAHPKVPEMGMRQLPFSGSILIERGDFAEVPPKKFKRLKPGGKVRLRFGYVVQCDEVVKDAAGEVAELRCTYVPGTKAGQGEKVKGIIHWVSEQHAVRATVRLYDRLFNVPKPGDGGADFLDDFNADSLIELRDCALEPSVAATAMGKQLQFERTGYFCKDLVSSEEELVFNRIVTLRDNWAKPAVAAEEKKDDKQKDDNRPKATAAAGISKAERDELEKLKNDLISRKNELKEGGMSGGQINKDPEIEAWVARLNELKEKEKQGS